MGLTSKQKLMMAVLIFGTFVTVLNQTVVTPALPSVMTEMGVDASTAQWLTTGFTLVNAIMIPITAFLTDRFSTRGLFLASMAMFTCGSLLAGWGPNFPVLLLGRLVQAAGAGILMPMVMTVLMLTFPVEKRGTAMGLFSIVIAFAPAIGPTVAGIIIDQANWHIMFFIISALSALVIVFAAIALEKTAPANKTAVTLDKPSVVLSSVGFGALLYGFSTIGATGVNVPDVATTLVGLVALVFFFRRQLHMEHPMLEVRVLKNRKFLVGTIIGMLVQAALLAASILVPIYVQSLLGQSATVSGLILLPGAILMGIMGPIAGRLFDRRGPRVIGIIGTGLLTVTTFALAFLTTETSIVFLTVLYTVRMFSLSLVNMPITTWGMNALDNKVMNHGTSVNNTLRQVAGSLGTAVIVSVTTMVTNANAESLGPVQANMLGIDVAFAVSGVLCLIGFVMVVALVKDRPSDAMEGRPPQRAQERAGSHHEARRVHRAGNGHRVRCRAAVRGQGHQRGAHRERRGRGRGLHIRRRRHALALAPRPHVHGPHRHDHAYRGGRPRLQREAGSAHGHERASDRRPRGSIGVDIHADLADVCRVLGENRLKKVPVMDEGRIVGMINRSDITQYSMKTYLENRA